jgi:hypothetical protein
MPRKSPKTEIVAFKVEEDLAEFLNKLPNKSDFIRKAIIAQFGMTCPLCIGSGVVARGLHNHFKPIIAKNSTKKCERCGEAQTLPLSLEGLSDKERARMEQFFHGGPLYCKKCYPEVPPCDDCGWHIPVEEAADHVRQAHAHAH